MDAESLRKYCLSLPSVTEDVKWGADLCFCIGEKMFCVTGLEGDFGVSLKANDEDFELLTAKPNIEPAPYLARAKWVRISGSNALNAKEWKHYIKQSYDLIKDKLTKKVQKELGIL